MSARILIVEDEVHQGKALKGLLELEGHEVDVCQSGAEALASSRGRGYELVLCDLRLPDMDGLEVYERIRRRSSEEEAPTFTILTAFGTVQNVIEALKKGVYDYLAKPVDDVELTKLVETVLESRRLRRQNLELSRGLRALSLDERLVGRSGPFQEMVELARSAAQSEATILIRGESGTGKELVAELIHSSSPRSEGPFVKVNCSAIPAPLLEAELFGHEQGAFTDARRARKGRFELAQGGTIFLDEIGDMSPALQVKLLRVLQEHELERLGGEGRVIPVDFRLVAATNRDLESMVKEGTFREDLYYRINVITIVSPPLRERPGDVELLAETFCRRFNEKNKKQFRGLSAQALTRLREHPWPGNVRQLENVIERAVVLGQGQWIEPEHLAGFSGPAGLGKTGLSSDDLVDLLVDAAVPLDEVERVAIREALRRTGGNVTQAARMLGITRRTLQYRMEKYGIPKAKETAQEKPSSA